MRRQSPGSTLFPYTTLFRSRDGEEREGVQPPSRHAAPMARSAQGKRAAVRRGNACSTDVTRARSEEHTSELQSRGHLVCRLLLEKKNKRIAHTRRRPEV